MDFFKIVRPNFFSVLTSKNKEIYVEALFVLQKIYKQELIIKKDDLVGLLISKLEDKMLSIEFEEEEAPTELNFSTLAHFIIRKFKQTGWIDSYENENFEEIILVNDYSIKLLNVLHEITDTSVKEYNSLVFSTYSELKLANEEKNDYTYLGLLKAHRNTQKLLDELKSLLNNIRRYHQEIIEHEELRDIFENHFVRFKENIADKVIHPLKTLDSIPRYRNPILNILKDWLSNQDLRETIAESAWVRGSYKDKEDAKNHVLVMIFEIMDSYENLNKLMDEIDKKNRFYTRATVEKIQYLVNYDRGIKGKIIELLKYVGKTNKDNTHEILKSMNESIQLVKNGYVDEDSLFSERTKRIKGERLNLNDFLEVDHNQIDTEVKELRKELKIFYTHKKIMDFITNQLGDNYEIESQALRIDDDEDFVKIILSTMKHDEKNIFYDIQFLENSILINGYRIPNMKIKRKEGT